MTETRPFCLKTTAATIPYTIDFGGIREFFVFKDELAVTSTNASKGRDILSVVTKQGTKRSNRLF